MTTEHVHAQQLNPYIEAKGISNPFIQNDATNPCITAEAYGQLNQQCFENLKKLGLDKIQHGSYQTLATSLMWPVKASANLFDAGFHFIGA